jgi:CubicO group peptidase (beta-lactamase class C family)
MASLIQRHRSLATVGINACQRDTHMQSFCKSFGSALLATLILYAKFAVAGTPPCDSPRAGADGWAVEASAGDAGFDAPRLCEILQGFANAHVNFHSLLIERHGRLVAEVYRRGKNPSLYSVIAPTTDFDATTRHDLRSVTKSIVSLLWGIAQGQRSTPPMDTPVLDLLPALENLKADGREAITIADLFTMSSGLDWREWGGYGLTNPETGLYWRSSQARYLFARPMVAAAGERFNYNGGGTAVLAQILAQRINMPLPEYARKYLFEPLGITDVEWMNDMRGRPVAFAGLRMRPRDLARIGRMILAHGQWQGRQIVPAAWLQDSTRGHIDAELGLRYGYFWWVGQTNVRGSTYDWSAGIGNGGQRLFLLPALDIVIVITAGEYNNFAIQSEDMQLFDRIIATVRE